ncbi:MAG: hypothetical protein KIT24_07145 [Phycisphaeraceae bacterium]|nr:hypothetical protein [Phycisphaeraceae bacterium]
MRFRVVRARGRVIAAGMLAMLSLGGCTRDNRPAPVWEPGAIAAWPFAPVQMHLHPLTHMERGPDGATMIVCHVELLDHWGDTAKGVGKLTIQLFRPTGGSRATAVGDMIWHIDLDDPQFNASMYDPSTRTYRLQLGGLPDWAIPSGSDYRSRLLLRAKFVGQGPDGTVREMTSELSIRT